MTFEELSYWMAAVAAHGDAVREAAEKAAEGNKR